jgi:hypothetical protein
MSTIEHDSLHIDGLLQLAHRRLGETQDHQLGGDVPAALVALAIAEDYLRRARQICEQHIASKHYPA